MTEAGRRTVVAGAVAALTVPVVVLVIGAGPVAASVPDAGPRPVVAGGPPVGNVSPPAVPVLPRFGQVAVADPGTWSDPAGAGASPTFAYQWLRDGQRIAGATSRRYRPGRTDVGHALAVRVTATVDGHSPSTATSPPRTVGRALVEVTESAENRRHREAGVRRGRSITLTFLLSRHADGGRASAVMLGTVVGRSSVVAGELVIRLDTSRVPDLEPGPRPFTIEYAGTPYAEPVSRDLWMQVH